MNALTRLTRSIRHRVVAVSFVLVLALGLLLVPTAGGASSNRSSHGNDRYHVSHRPHRPKRICTTREWHPGHWERIGRKWRWRHGWWEIHIIKCPPASP